MLGALALVSLAGPRLVAGLVILPYESLALSRLADQPDAWVGRAAAAYATAGGWYAGDSVASRHARLRYALVERSRADRPAPIAAAVAAQRAAVSRRPIDPHGWTRLAGSLDTRGATGSRRFETALANGISTGPWGPGLMAVRGRLGVLAGDRLTPATRDAVRVQLRRAGRYTPGRLANVITEPGLRRLVLAALAEYPFARCRAAAAFAGQLRAAICAAAAGGESLGEADTQ